MQHHLSNESCMPQVAMTAPLTLEKKTVINVSYDQFILNTLHFGTPRISAQQMTL